MNTQHWQLYVTQSDSTVHSYDKTGQLCTSRHSSGLLHEPPPQKKNIARLPLQAPYLPTHTPYHTPYTSYADRLPTSAAVHLPCPLTTLRNHHPCQVQADPAILSATVRVSWSRVSCTAAATVGDLITAKWEAYRRLSSMEWLWAHAALLTIKCLSFLTETFSAYMTEIMNEWLWDCVSIGQWPRVCTWHVARFW